MSADELRTAHEQGRDPYAPGRDLHGVNLYGENLQNADLRGANLQGAILFNAHLRGANLQGADLRDAELNGADLRDVNLQNADLQDANLYGADLRGANLRDAILYGSDLRNTDLHYANLHNTDLRAANLYCANWDGLVIHGLPSGAAYFTPPSAHDDNPEWNITIGCWKGTITQLQTLIDGDKWPAAKDIEQARRRPGLQILIRLFEAHINYVVKKGDPK